jgi:hypothetical protein
VPALATALGLGVSAGGCEFAVGDTLPGYMCVPGDFDVCPSGSICDPGSRRCVRPGVGAHGPDGSAPGVDATADDADADDVTATGRDGQGEDGPDSSTNVNDGSSDGPGTVRDTEPPEGGVCNTLGCLCSGPAACANGVCVSDVAVTSPVAKAAGNGNFCSQPCCTSADCPAASVCFASGRGGNYCVLPEWLGRTTALGKAIGGAACQSNGDCRSGLCASMMCADPCCSATGSAGECATGTTCRFGAFPGVSFDTHAAALCGPSGTCGTGFQCDKPCRNTAECGANQACYYLPATLPSSDISAACTAANGSGAQGSRCTSDFQCASNFCDTTGSVTMECSDVCFSNADCKVDGWYCRPESIMVTSGGTYSVLVCGP